MTTIPTAAQSAAPSGFALTSGLSKGWRTALTVLFSIVLLTGILNGYRMCAYGMNFSDEPYHILNAMDYKNAPLTVLNALIGHAFGSLFGWEYINFRYLAWTFDFLSILIAGSFLLWKSRDLLISLGFTSAVVVYESISPLLFRLYGWDCLVALVLTIAICLTLYYAENPSKTTLVALAILTGCAILIKVTTVALVPVIAFFFIWKFRKLQDAAILTAIAIAVAVIGILAIYGSPSEFLMYMRLNSNPEHGSMLTLMKIWSIDVICILPFVAFYIGLFYIVNRICSGKIWITLASLFIGTVICFYINRIHFGTEPRLIWSSVAVAVIAVAATKNLPAALIIFSISLLSAIGSDRGILKFVSFSSMLIALSYFINRQNLRTALISGLIIFISSTAFRYSKARASSFNDAGLPYLTETIKSPEIIKGMRTTPERVRLINNTLELCGSERTFVVGDTVNKFLYELMLGNINPYLRQGFGKRDNYQKQWYADSVAAHISRAPKGMQYIYLSTDTTTLMYGMLHERMPEKGRTDNAILFVKK